MGFRHIIICVISSFLLTVSLYGQTSESETPHPEALLTRYELLCSDCLELKSRVAEGFPVSRQEASGLISEFVDMNRRLKTMTDSMSTLQKSRFEMINRWFSSGIKPSALTHEPFSYSICSIRCDSLKYSSGICVCGHSGTSERPSSAGRAKIYAMADISVPLSYGLMLGIRDARGYRNWGGYVRFRSSFIFTDTSYSYFSDGTLDGGAPFWGNGSSLRSNLMVAGGVLYGVAGWLDIYAGAGYGFRRHCRQDIDGAWATVSDVSHQGLAAEAGVIVSWKAICAGVGV